jgi:hypothetical protein
MRTSTGATTLPRARSVSTCEECLDGADDARVEDVGAVAGDAHNHGTRGLREAAGMVPSNHVLDILLALPLTRKWPPGKLIRPPAARSPRT